MALPCKRYTFLPQVIDGNLIYEELPCNRYAPLPQVIGTVMMWLKCNVNVLVLNSSDYVTYDCVRFQVIRCINAINEGVYRNPVRPSMYLVSATPSKQLIGFL